MSDVAVNSAAQWAEACSAAFVPLRVRSAAPEFSAALRQQVLTPDVSLTRVASGASEVYRSDRVIAQHPRDDIIVSLHRDGSGLVTQYGREARLRQGSAAMYDASAPYVLAFPGQMSEVVLQLPRRCLATVGHAFTDLTARPLPQGGPLTALTALAVSADARPQGHRPLEDAAIGDALVALLVAVVATDTASAAPPVDSALLGISLRQFIEDHLADPRLSPEYVACAHHISLRQLQKLFARDGDSPAAYIRRRRLETARRLLLQGAKAGRASASVGFSDADTFTRAFKREFGMPPSAIGPGTAGSTFS
jgi:AraC-like DNA-binding protein